MTQADLFAARDRTLDRHRSRHAGLIAAARVVALCICAERGRVTSPEVLERMRAQGWGDLLGAANGRWMGSVLNPLNGFERTGEWLPIGSKGRHVPCWRVKT